MLFDTSPTATAFTHNFDLVLLFGKSKNTIVYSPRCRIDQANFGLLLYTLIHNECHFCRNQLLQANLLDFESYRIFFGGPRPHKSLAKAGRFLNPLGPINCFFVTNLSPRLALGDILLQLCWLVGLIDIIDRLIH